MTSLFMGSHEKPEPHSRSNSTTGASYSVRHPGAPAPKLPWDYGGHKGSHTACIIRIDSSCGYACFWGLFGVLVAFWGVFEGAAKVGNLTTSNGRVARVQSIRDNMQVIGLKIVDRKSTRLNSSHLSQSRMPSSA